MNELDSLEAIVPVIEAVLWPNDALQCHKALGLHAFAYSCYAYKPCGAPQALVPHFKVLSGVRSVLHLYGSTTEEEGIPKHTLGLALQHIATIRGIAFMHHSQTQPLPFTP